MLPPRFKFNGNVLEATIINDSIPMNIEDFDMQMLLRQHRKAFSKTEHKLAQVLNKKSTAFQHKNALCMCANRAINYKKAVADILKAHNLKSKGVFKDTSWEMVQDLVVCGVPLQNINSVIQTISHGVGVDLWDSIDKHSVSHIVHKGGLAAEMQLVQEIHHGGR
jgi:hypothetical protein